VIHGTQMIEYATLAANTRRSRTRITKSRR